MTRLSPRRFVGIAASVSVAVRGAGNEGHEGDSPAGAPAQSMSLGCGSFSSAGPEMCKGVLRAAWQELLDPSKAG